MTDTSPAELVARAAAGEELAWRELIARYEPLLQRVARSFRLGEEETADAVATTWLKLVEHIGSLRDGGRVASWLTTTLRRECLSRLHQRRRERLIGEFIGANEPAHDVDLNQGLVDEERQRLVARLLTQLPVRQRRLVLMLFADPSPSYQHISASLAIPLGSIGPTRTRLLLKLRERLGSQGSGLLQASC